MVKQIDLQEDLDLYFDIFNTLGTPIFLKDKNHRFIMVNDSFCTLFKIKREEFVGRTDKELFPEREWKVFHEKDRKILLTGITDENEEDASIPGGKVLRVLTKKSLFKTAGGKKYVLGVVTDLTEKIHLLKASSENEMMYREMVELSPIPLFIHNDGIIVFANDAAKSYVGISDEDLMGKNIGRIVRIPGISTEDGDPVTMFQNPSQPGRATDFFLKISEGIPRNLLIRNVRIKYKGQDVIMSMILDITERQNLENYIINRIIEVEENERKRFAADLHDDLGPFISTIKLHLGILEKAGDPVRTQKSILALDIMLNEVISKVHQISHSISPHLLEDFGLAGALTDYCQHINKNNIFRVLLRHNLQNVRFQNEIELHFYRIICELMNNSMKHAGAKKMTIDLQYKNEILQLKYSDNGKGYRVREILKKSKGMGIPNIIHRINLINGNIQFVKETNKMNVMIKVRINNINTSSKPVTQIPHVLK